MKDKVPEFVRQQLVIFAVISRIGIVIQESLETMTNIPKILRLLPEYIIIVTNVPDHRMVGGRGRIPSQVSKGYHRLAPSHPPCLSWITFLGLIRPL